MTTPDTRTKPVINVCLLQPAGYVHAMALLEAAEYVAEKVRLAGYESVLSKNRLFQHGMNIVFGTHINPKDNPDFPPNTVIFNTEQIPEKSVWISSQYKACLDRHFVWDYSDSNLKMIGHQKTGLIDFYHVDMLQRIAPTQQTEYDGYERDCLLGKARAVLNLHFYESQIFQQIRAFYALSNGMPVISENYPEASAPPLYKAVLFTPGTRQFEDFAAELLSHDESFRLESKTRLERFYASRGNTDFNQVLEKTIRAVIGENPLNSPATSPAPSRINLLDRHYLQGHLNIGTDPSTNPDAILDLSLPLKLPATLSSKTWGTTTLSENQLDEIVAVDALARVQQLTQLMDNCLKLLREGGKLTITVPYELSLGAWQDPSHVRAFNENSWLQYTQRFWQIGWLNYRFDITESSMNLTDFGKTMVARNMVQDEILRTPRAIESMRIVLTKRKTSPEERLLACAHSSGFMPGATG